MILRRGWIVVCLPLMLCLAACSGIVAPDQTNSGLPPITLRAGESVGQTFVARQMGLAGVEIYLAPGSSATGDLRLSLRPDSTSTTELASGAISAATVTAPGYYRFNFTPQTYSRQTYYAVRLELIGDGEVQVGQGAAESYLDGAMYHNDEPIEAQMMFRLVYDTPLGLFGVALMLGEWVVWSVAGLALFVLPGWAALTYFWPSDAPLDGLAKFGIAVGLSVALYPVLMLWTHIIGLQLGWGYAWLPVSVAAGAMVWWHRHVQLDSLGAALVRWRHAETIWADVTLLFVVGLTFGLRYWLIRNQEAPMWGDSVHHTMIAQLMLDNGGLFQSWLPYAELSTFTYHFGFHSAAAVFAWLTGLDILRAVMWTGQILNGLAVLALWPLALRLSNNRWAAVATVVVAGLLSPMPNYYVNWGRYTQLAGQVILPAAMALAWWIVEHRGAVPRAVWMLGALAWDGLALTHYRVLIFGALFIIVLIGVEMLSGRWHTAFLRPAILSFGAFTLFLPWFVRVFAGRLIDIFTNVVLKPPAALTDFERQSNSLGDITFYLPMMLWWLVLGSAMSSLVWRRQAGSLMVVWAGLVLFSANPLWLGLPGSGIVGSPTVMMGSYMFAGIILGAVIGWLNMWTGENTRSAYVKLIAPLGVSGLLSLVALFGLRQRFNDYRPDLHALLTRPDRRAAVWIQTNTAPNARFLVSDFFAYDGELLVGSDGGWWLPQLTRRLTTLPPMTYGSERGSERLSLQSVNMRAAIVEHYGAQSDESLSMLRANGITHIYLGQREGRIGLSASSWLSRGAFLESDDFELIYHQDQVYIFAILP